MKYIKVIFFQKLENLIKTVLLFFQQHFETLGVSGLKKQIVLLSQISKNQDKHNNAHTHIYI